MKIFNTKILFFGFTDSDSPLLSSKVFHEHITKCDKEEDECPCMQAIVLKMFNGMFEAQLHKNAIGAIYVNGEIVDWGFDHPREEDGLPTEFLESIQTHIDGNLELAMLVEDLIEMKLNQLNKEFDNLGTDAENLSKEDIEMHRNEWLEYLHTLKSKVKESG